MEKQQRCTIFGGRMAGFCRYFHDAGQVERMKRRLTEIGSRIGKDIRQYGPGLLAVVILYFAVHRLFDAFCPSVLITGFPCPGCGMTRATLYLLRGQVARSVALNPAAVFWMMWAALFAFERYGKGRSPKLLIRGAMGIILFMIVAYIIRMKLYFPHRPPYVYTRDNLFSRILPGYRTIVGYLL